jgi:serine/threonine protein kinase
MAITIGTRLGSYEVTALLGKGGMGEVYRARDTKLGRDVAIKLLPTSDTLADFNASESTFEAQPAVELFDTGYVDFQHSPGGSYLPYAVFTRRRTVLIPRPRETRIAADYADCADKNVR